MLEKLNAAHNFPCRYEFKLLGVNSETFRNHARKVLSEHCPDVAYSARERASRKGTYVSLSITLCVENAEKVIELYQAFHRIPDIKTTL